MGDDVIAALTAALGADSVRTGAAIAARNQADSSGLAPVLPRAVILPRNTDQVAVALRLCLAAGQPVVPQGGMTGLAGGAHPGPAEIALSLERMVGVEEVDAVGGTLTALAGTPLETVQTAAEAAGFLLGVDLGARGSCTVGGVVATNAGGNQVLRYGMTRANLRGLEVVLADGRVIRTPGKMLKNNTGYDWTQLFIGSEGTLGIVTRATFLLHPRPAQRDSALVRVADTAAALDLLRDLGARLPAGLLVYEAMWQEFYEIAIGPMGRSGPFPPGPGLCLLIEAPGYGEGAEVGLTEALAANLDRGVISDAVIARSEADRLGFWALRESVYEHNRHFPPTIGFDISIPLDAMAAAVDQLRARITARFPGQPWVVFGHLADCNLHVNLMATADHRKAIEDTVYGVVADFAGSVSAEHGIGRLKAPYLALTRSPAEIQLMAGIKALLDPRGILSPGRVLPPPAGG